MILGDLEQFAAFERGLMGHDSRDRQVQGREDVHQRLAILEDRGHKLVHQVPVRSPMGSGFQRPGLGIQRVPMQGEGFQAET